MTPRHSLRRRIMVAFLTGGVVSGALAGIALLFISVELQEWHAQRQLTQRLDAIAEDPAGRQPLRPDRMSDTRVYGAVPLEAIPEALLRLPDGLHEHESDDRALLIALTSTPEGRIVVVEDITPIERREGHGWYYALAGAGLTTGLALIAAFVVARRLTAPLEALTARLAHDNEDGLGAPLANRLADDEIGTLARALDRYRDRVREALWREQRFSADISHELRNPLAVIRSSAELISADTALSTTSRRAVNRLDSAAERMQEITTALLALLREPTTDAAHPPVNVSDRVDRVLEHERAAAEHPLEVTVAYGEPPGARVSAPVAVVDTVLGNLIRNALQHSRGHHLHIAIAVDHVDVIDDGVGMTDEAVAHLDNAPGPTRRDRSAGTGLGIPLTRRLCEHFDWSLHIHGRPHQGTTVTWWFTAPPVAIPQPRHDDHQPDGL